MEQPPARYYKGYFHSQFITDRVRDKMSWKWSDIKLEQRFLLKVEKEISIEDFEAAKAVRLSEDTTKWQSTWHPGYQHEVKKLKPHVLLTDNNEIELEFSDYVVCKEICSELFVEFDDPGIPAELRSQDFTTGKDGTYHGRLTGIGYARIPVLTEDEKARKKLEILSREGKRKSGCLAPFLPSGSLGGWGGLSSLGSSLSLAQRGGCGRSGCGLLGLFLLLGLLFAWWKGCSIGGHTSPRVIHDTVYVDEKSKQNVIKQFLDTTTIFKTEAVELPNVQFYSNSAKLLPYSINSIQELADYLIAHPMVHAVIEGHTDNIGDPEGNLKLSKARAETVRAVLISFGVEAERVDAAGFGKSRPRADNSTVEGRALNRRVEVRLTNTEYTETKSTEVKDGN